MTPTNRPVDKAVKLFTRMTIGASVGLFGLLMVWLALIDAADAPYLNVGFTASWVVGVLAALGMVNYARKRPAGAPLSWGEAYIGAAAVFALMFWIYGVVPHLWITFSDSELSWRSDRALVGPMLPGWVAEDQNLLTWVLPFNLNYQVVRDLVAVIIYGMGLTANVAAFSIWQNRGREAEDIKPRRSKYGRPLRAAKTPAEVVEVSG